jgi:hypothetical protein
MSGRHRRGPAPRRGRHRRPPSRQRLIVPALAAAAVLAGSGTAVGFALGPGGSSGGLATTAVPFAAPAVLSSAPVIDPTPSIAPSAPAAAHQSHTPGASHPRPTDTLSMRVTGSESYVQVMTWNNHLLLRRILHHGQRLSYRQHGLQVVLGNAGAVRMSVDGHAARSAGHSGQVRRFRVN